MKTLQRPKTELLGRTVGGRYVVTGVLGAGGMGTVYEARDRVTGVSLAIKGLNRSAFTSVNLRRLRFEAEIASRLEHEHICRVYHMGVEGGAPFLVMERLEGETLRSWLRREGPLAAADAILITMQILSALEAAHRAGVIHRDVKPSNVFITAARGSEPHVKLIDFGLAKALQLPVVGEDDDEGITATDVVPGTPQYLTPEQILGQRDLDERVDVWAAALTFFEMLSGRRVQSTALVHEALATKILNDPPPTISGRRTDIPPAIDDVLAHALAKDRQRRFASATAFRTALVAVWSQYRAQGIARGRSFVRGESAGAQGAPPERRRPTRDAVARGPAGPAAVPVKHDSLDTRSLGRKL